MSLLRNRREKPKILCVDDEEQVLEGLKLNLRRHFTVHTGVGGAEGLKVLAEEGPFVAVVSDMRMPKMNGAEFLGHVREQAPDTVRILLTGYSEMSAAISAVNDGGIFRFLTKPCPKEKLVATLEDATSLYKLVTAEKELLEETLRGSVKMLSDVLALTSPRGFGRAHRVEEVARDIGVRLGITPMWQLEVAALLSQIGCVILPEATLARFLDGEALTERDQTMFARLPKVTDELLGNIPRLEGVRDIIQVALTAPNAPLQLSRSEDADMVRLSAHVLAASLAYDRQLGMGKAPQAAVTKLGRGFDPGVYEVFNEYVAEQTATPVREVNIMELRQGMVLSQDICSSKGVLLVARGTIVSQSLVLRIRNYRTGVIQEPIVVEDVGLELRASA